MVRGEQMTAFRRLSCTGSEFCCEPRACLMTKTALDIELLQTINDGTVQWRIYSSTSQIIVQKNTDVDVNVYESEQRSDCILFRVFLYA